MIKIAGEKTACLDNKIIVALVFRRIESLPN